MDRKPVKQSKKEKRMIRLAVYAVGLIIIAAIVILIISCTGKNKANDEAQTPETTEAGIPAEVIYENSTQETETVQMPLNDKPVKLYYMNYAEAQAELVTEYAAPWTTEEDLATFGAYNTDAQTIPIDSEKSSHEDPWWSVDTAVTYKIGYEISFETEEGHQVVTILEPKDLDNNPLLFNGDIDSTPQIDQYFGVWLYDDINQEGTWYSHLLQSEVTEDTLITSIKLRPVEKSFQINNMKLKAFSYSDRNVEFDEAGHYIGNYGYEIDIVNLAR
ncbi:MAG: hypothetical protein HUJ75_01025 [Parasporobacterium sp.]|nr:hypothetical protein [Parasporobacterium sp.]